MTDERRKPGRPRKWSSDAERQRAYRLRRAEELADPLQLRKELKQASRRADQLEAELERTVAQLERAQRSAAKAKEQHDRLQDDLKQLRFANERLREARGFTKTRQAPPPPPWEP